eukprot:TRINITY_DN5866_c0_g1_i1.p1 TRINITY_DN5866_c0_g1~~TRINITY_DN5866_c0_g1_i1.p1  ORF type:complete len:138 (-),score=28.93 TRINITY_DN5866_c0_g1_i1:123-536(-)
MNSTIVLSPSRCHSLTTNDISLSLFNDNSSNRIQLSPPAKRSNASPFSKSEINNENTKGVLLKPKVLRLNQDLKKRLAQDALIEEFVDGIVDNRKKKLYNQMAKRIKLKIVPKHDIIKRENDLYNGSEQRVIFKHKF